MNAVGPYIIIAVLLIVQLFQCSAGTYTSTIVVARTAAMDVKILLLGDAGVGKSSLLSSYASDRFPDPDSIPQILASVKVPPELNANGNNVTIQDSSSLGSDREVLKSKIKSSNSIIAVYDSTRLETLDSLNDEWLPLVRDIWLGSSGADKDSTTISSSSAEGALIASYKSSNKAVILCAAKIDLLDESDTVRAEEEVHKVNSIISSFPFVSACCRSSSKLLNVSDTFYYADMVVSFPLQPLYDTCQGDFKIECKRALTRICRIYDSDNDGYLADKDLNSLQAASFNNQQLNDEDIVAMRKQAAACTPGCVTSQGMSYAGFIGYVRLYIDKSKPIVPWTILKSHDYSSKLVLDVSPHINVVPRFSDSGNLGGSDKITLLTESAMRFLRSIATESFDSYLGSQVSLAAASSREVVLNEQMIQSIFSVLSPSELRDVPWLSSSNYSSSSSNSFVFREGQESVYVLCGGARQFFDMNEWLAQWEMLAVVNPSLTQNLLFRLGYARRSDLGTAASQGRMHILDATRRRKRSVYRVCVLGADEVGKTALLTLLSGSLQKPYSDAGDSATKDISAYFANLTTPSKEHGREFVSSYSNAHIVTKKVERRERRSKAFSIFESARAVMGLSIGGSVNRRAGDAESDFVTTIITDNISIVLTEVPFEKHIDWLSRHVNSCDLAILLFNCSDKSADNTEGTFEIAKRLEGKLPSTTPRIFIGNKVDTVMHDGVLSVSLDAVSDHIADMELMPLIKISCSMGTGVSECAERVLTVLADRGAGLPLLKKQLHQRRRHIAIAGASITALVLSGLGLHFYVSRSKSGISGVGGALSRVFF